MTSPRGPKFGHVALLCGFAHVTSCKTFAPVVRYKIRSRDLNTPIAKPKLRGVGLKFLTCDCKDQMTTKY